MCRSVQGSAHTLAELAVLLGLNLIEKLHTAYVQHVEIELQFAIILCPTALPTMARSTTRMLAKGMPQDESCVVEHRGLASRM